jgi:hypothetical protein
MFLKRIICGLQMDSPGVREYTYYVGPPSDSGVVDNIYSSCYANVKFHKMAHMIKVDISI